MVRVVPDTNIVGGKKGRPLESNEMRRLLDETRRGNLELVLPRIVVSEAANLWAEQVIETAAQFKSSASILRQAGVVQALDHLIPEKSTVRSDEERRIETLVTAAGGAIAPLPSVSHSAVVERALGRRQPFDPQGRNGYRDVLLWETVLGLVGKDDPLFFIARDKGAFFSKGAEELAARLRGEVEERCGAADAVLLYFDASRAIEAALEYSAKAAEQQQTTALEQQRQANGMALQELNRLLQDDSGFATLLADAVEEALGYMDLGSDLRPFGVSDGDVYDAHIDIVEDLENWRFTSAHVAENGLVLAEVTADLGSTASITLHPSTATLLDDHPQIRISDFGYGTSRAEGEAIVRARVTCDVVVNRDQAQLASLATVSHFDPLDG